MVDIIESIVIIFHITNRNHTFGIDIGKFDKYTKTHYARNNTIKSFANFVTHIFTFKPFFHITSSFVRSTLCYGQFGTEFNHSFTWFSGIFSQNTLNSTMHQQIRITPNWRGKMRIVFKSQAKMPFISRRINCLLHRAQHNSFNNIFIVPPFGIF